MKIFLKIIFFVYFYSYIFSFKVTKIETPNATLGEDATFILTVEDYNLSNYYDFTLGDYYDNSLILMDCEPTNDTSLKCDANLNINDLQNLKNLTKTLYINGEKTDLTVSIDSSAISSVITPKSSFSYLISNPTIDITAFPITLIQSLR